MQAPHAISFPLLSLTSLRKSVPGGRVLFSGLNLSMNPGEFVAIHMASQGYWQVQDDGKR